MEYEKMGSIFRKEAINTGRQYNLDLLKALAIVSMIICHTVTILSGARADYANEFGYQFADAFLGGYFAVAHAFMLCMGVGFVYSKNNGPKALLVRGIKIYILSYVLNFFRGGMYAIAVGILRSRYSEIITYSLLNQDILQFAGLAMILTAFFKKLKLDCRVILAISVIMSVFSQWAALKYQGNTFMNILIGTFVPTVKDYSVFVLCGWYLFVAVGICFGELLQRISDLKRFYSWLLGISGVVMIVYITASVQNGCFFLSPGRIYYYAGGLEAIGLLSIDFVLMSLMYFALDRLPKRQWTGNRFLGICWKMSRNINQIYFAQWCIIGFLSVIFVYELKLPMPYWITYPMGIIIVPLSYIAADLWIRHSSHH